MTHRPTEDAALRNLEAAASLLARFAALRWLGDPRRPPWVLTRFEAAALRKERAQPQYNADYGAYFPGVIDRVEDRLRLRLALGLGIDMGCIDRPAGRGR
jgi:hypothetical protein